MKRLPPLSLLLFLCGCGGYYSVRVPHRLPDAPGAAALRPSLGAVYVVVRPPESPLSAAGSAADALLGDPGPDMDLGALARSAAASLKSPAGACAWEAGRPGGEPGRFAGRFSPSGLLVISPRLPALASSKEERASVRYDKNKNKQTVNTTVFVYTAALSAEVRLLAWPGREVLDSWTAAASLSEERYDASRGTEDWYASKEEKLFARLAGDIAARYSGRSVDRFRPVFKIKKDGQSEKAFSLARSGSWDGAAEIWSARAGKGGWRDHLGLAVAAEVAGNYGPALELYRRAEAAAAGDKAAAPVRWKEIYGDLENALAAPAERACDRSWFSVKTAVLPFSDDTTSIDGPALVRGLVFDGLKAAGYDLVPLEETDEALRRHGYSDGGQLAAAKPEELARWLGAGRLVYCDISDYGEIMAGVYNRRMVAGEARVWEASAGEFSFREAVVKVKTQKDLLGGLAGQLARGMAERIKNKPLGYEAGVFSRRVTGNLPAAAR